MQSETEVQKRAARRVEKRRRIIDCARTVFFRDGFQHANLNEVAQSAEVAKGTLYRYFENKGDLYVAVLAENGAAFESKMREVAKQPGSATDRVRALGRFYFEHWVTHREYFRIFWAFENQSLIGELPAQVVESVAGLWESCLGILAEVVKRGVESGEFADRDPWEVANILWTTANGVIQIELVSTQRELLRRPVAEVFETGLELFLSGLAAPACSAGERA